MNNTKTIHKTRALGSTWVHVVPAGVGPREDEPVFAVNWFNVRSLMLYQIYNLLAAKLLRTVGGEPMFKGRLVRRIHGSEDLERSTLLIVRYPSIQSFLRLMGNRYFNVIGILRMLAVRDFSFGLTQPSGTQDYEPDRRVAECYLVRHNGEQEPLSLQAIDIYSGTVVATLGTGSEELASTHIPCLMNQFAISELSSKETTTLPRVSGEEAATADSGFAGLFRRIDQ